MDNVKDDIYYLIKIVNDMRFLVEHTKGKSKEDVSTDEVLIDSIMFRLIQISENSVKLTDSFKNQNSDIPWFAIKGMKNRIVHDYGSVDYSVIYETVINEIPQCLKILEKFMRQ